MLRAPKSSLEVSVERAALGSRPGGRKRQLGIIFLFLFFLVLFCFLEFYCDGDKAMMCIPCEPTGFLLFLFLLARWSLIHSGLIEAIRLRFD